jgi:putative pyruvate formate lyase activating enzyme
MNQSSDELMHCALCPRACGINRLRGEKGYCGAAATTRIFRYGPHFGEEPPLTGVNGSGALFFSHCTMRCIYCQNHPWSQGGAGQDFAIEQLRGLFTQIIAQGCHNWNLVSPTPWLPQILEAVSPLIRAGKSLPFVYNTSGFESEKTLNAYKELCDIALVDLRYASRKSAKEGSDAAEYVEQSRRTLNWFWHELGPLEVDRDNIARRGVICRILALPGRIDEAITNLQWIASHLGNKVHISVMSQYTPVHTALETAGWNTKVQQKEYEKLTNVAAELGFENGWIQEFNGDAPADLLGQAMPSGEGSVGLQRNAVLSDANTPCE